MNATSSTGQEDIGNGAVLGGGAGAVDRLWTLLHGMSRAGGLTQGDHGSVKQSMITRAPNEAYRRITLAVRLEMHLVGGHDLSLPVRNLLQDAFIGARAVPALEEW
jgi:hypothetical protein